MTTKYIPVTGVAAMIRTALKEAFPGVKFGVRTSKYAGGSSIRVSYTDGPCARLVESITNTFEGSYFDGMTDYKGTNYHTLDGQPVSLGGDFIFVNREISDRIRAMIIRRVFAKFGHPVSGTDDEVLSAFRNSELAPGISWQDRRSIENQAQQAMAKHSDRLSAQPSKTAARIGFAGDDGHGFNSVGGAV